ncbi:MAG: holo-[acyl-carrier-protein] synthase [Desulfovibrio desulfuricans]|uniref:Holo-[acyl-carrier-protein] synthase n=1 Tax=Desulfovibrio desulfuricans (strain ATCC 27774 / DSM 6949 / MB) TaxID=525146 RepID=ACPS_DESDA|nr:RecName: Full=Holo-[acyl-carrier-protein] synthase; Short=Holo-ACP synthase; AltName: Full=4'-phosphopantetheinyl transferase AcpS [Desulfovibrio desulfuricans ATCC 27774]MDY0203629.1 holo-[acyl-carrier-protein] synthase [Desulfovibrio desulfuricans]
MIVGLGVDIVELARIEKSLTRFGRRFAEKVLSPEEMAAMPTLTVNYIAGRFAVKEAAVKALGTGFSQGIGPTLVETVATSGGKPQLRLHGAALQCARDLGVTSCHVSISHDRSSAVAVVVLEAL